jgi:8-oxo-dGTP diphosphatase
MSDKRLHIAVGVILNQQKDKVLLALRHDNVEQCGLWEFPGGKLEDDEEVLIALKRELFEELNLIVDNCSPLVLIDHDYPTHRVRLDVWCVNQWHGDIRGKEGQSIEWVDISKLKTREFPEANQMIIEAVESQQTNSLEVD